MVIAVDFDGTIVTHEYPAIGREIPFAIETLKRFQTEGHHILILWTVREDELLKEAVEYCRERGLEFYAVNSNYPDGELIDTQPRKLNAEVFIDDRNIGGLPDWGHIYQMIMSGKPFTPVTSDNYTVRQEPPKKKWYERFINIEKPQ